MNLLLLTSSTVALVLLVVHSWQTRGRAVTLIFFISAFAFGILRGNAIWLLSRLLGGTDQALMPYLPQGGLLPDVGYSSIQVAAGWVFAMYLAWTVSELILRRMGDGVRRKGDSPPNSVKGTVPFSSVPFSSVPFSSVPFSSRVFMISGLASVFMLAICYGMETTAVSVGWWYWSLPTRSALFGNVNVWAMEGWFSVIPDFLIPFLMIACSEGKGARHPNGVKVPGPFSLKWLWLLAFPLHILGHLACRWFPYAILTYNAMELLVVSLMMFSRARMARGEMSGPEGRKGDCPLYAVRGTVPFSSLIGIALVIFLGVMAVSNVFGGEGIAGQLTLVPMFLLCVLAWRRLPVWGVLALSVAAAGGWYWIGARALYALVPVAVFGFLKLIELLREPLWTRLVAPAATVGLTACSALLFHADLERIGLYTGAWRDGDRSAFAGKWDEAEAAYRKADLLRPRDPELMYQATQQMAAEPVSDPRVSVRLFRYRMARLTRELEEVLRRAPEWAEPRETLVRFHLLRGDLSFATERYRELLRCRPHHPEVMTMLGYLLLREGDIGEAERIYAHVAGMRRPPVAALVNLGVIRFCQKRDDEARRLWELALAKSPEQTIARLNLERLKDSASGRDIDLRFLARTQTSRELAAGTSILAAVGTDYTPADRLRLHLEATQFDPDCLLAHMSLADLYLRKGSVFSDEGRALWHARRAVAIAGTSRESAKLAQGLLLLGRALLANGKPQEARRAFEEGRSLAPPEMRSDFDAFR